MKEANSKVKRRIFLLAFLVLVLQAVMKSWSINASDAVKKEDTIGGAMLKSLAESGEQGLSGLFMPGIAFAMENGSQLP